MKPSFTSSERRGALLLAALLVIVAAAIIFSRGYHYSRMPVAITVIDTTAHKVKSKLMRDSSVKSNRKKARRKPGAKKESKHPDNNSERNPLNEIISEAK